MSTRITSPDFDVFEWAEENERFARLAYEKFKAERET